MERQALTLRERKQQRTREAIVGAALALFAERGFDAVTVTDITDRAEVGRSTFFRYFGDKQEVVFAGDDTIHPAAVAAADAAVTTPIEDSLPAALGFIRRVVVAFVEAITREPEMYELHEELVARHPELQARSLMKQRSHAEVLTGLLTERGVGPENATLAAEIGLACFLAGRAQAGNDPRRLPQSVDAAFARLGTA